MSLPRLLVLTDRRQSEAAGRLLPETVAAAVGAGARAVVFREKDLPGPQRRELAASVCDAARGGRALMLVASDIALAHAVGAAGVHLAATDPWPDAGQVGDLVVGRSCHTVDDVAAAGLCRAAYVTLSPVHHSPSKPDYGPPLHLDGLAAGTRAPGAPPVYALGGVRAGRAAPCIDAGAAGVAVMGSAMGAADPAAVITALLAELGPATVLLVHGGLGEIDAHRFWAEPGVVSALEASGRRVLAPDRLTDPASWFAEGDHLAAAVAREPAPVAAVAGSNGCSAAVRLAADHPHLVRRLVLCWPATDADRTMRGVDDRELTVLDVPTAVIPADPEDPYHERATAERLASLIPGARLLGGTPASPRPDFGPARARFVATALAAIAPW